MSQAQARPLLYELEKMLKGADFKGVVLNKKDGSIFRILNDTAANMRRYEFYVTLHVVTSSNQARSTLPA